MGILGRGFITATPKSRYTKFATIDPGKKGRYQIIRGWGRKTGWKTQSHVLKLKDYRDSNQVINQINRLKISLSKKRRARKLARGWFR